MKNVNINKLPLLDLWYDNESNTKWRVNVPFNPYFPLWSGIRTNSSSLTYFEIEPGDTLGEHSDSAEEILFVLSGTAEVGIEGEKCTVSAGELLVVPANKPHFVMNNGREVSKFIGFYATAELHSTFSEEVSPVGRKEL